MVRAVIGAKPAVLHTGGVVCDRAITGGLAILRRHGTVCVGPWRRGYRVVVSAVTRLSLADDRDWPSQGGKICRGVRDAGVGDLASAGVEDNDHRGT